ncbi:hypothetical protein DOY81_007519, partial [Sarcophaga bullata]
LTDFAYLTTTQMDAPNTVTTTKKKTKKLLTLTQAEEQHLSSISSCSASTTTTTSIGKKLSSVKMTKTKSEDQITKTQMIKTVTKKESVKNLTEAPSSDLLREEEKVQEEQQNGLQQNCNHKNDENGNEIGDSAKKNNVTKKKNKLKKNKKNETDKQNISVKSSFSKFDALQKRNLIHVRSIDASTAQEKFSNPQGEVQANCRLCHKPVYKMEEVKAEKRIYHKNCFRCHECKKQLKADTYQSHEGILYCTVHLKLLFAPKCVEDDEPVQPPKPELIIRENQPTELPPDVVRGSNKPDLGLQELQQLNVRSRFQVFEQGKADSNEDQEDSRVHNNNSSNNVVKRSASILSKVAKLQQLGVSGSKQSYSNASSEDDDDDSTCDNTNADLIYQKKSEQTRERPIGIGEAMNDIRTLFEKGHGVTKEERREERKQEIQNIRSRLFMGKQARIKEMYQQAVAESEHAADKKREIDIEIDSKSLRERFEKGEAFKDNQLTIENDGEGSKKGAIEKEAEVFESAISKKSRSIFMELDANVVNGKNILASQSSSRNLQQQKSVSSIDSQSKVSDLDTDVVKCGEAVEDVKIETSEISEKFKFFETYHKPECKKRVFRITPPREGVVKMPSPDEYLNKDSVKEVSPDRNIIVHSRTTSMMLNKFREMEKNPQGANNDSPKPLKSFTPPPDGNRRLYVEQNSDEYDSNYDDDDDDDDEEDEGSEMDDADDYYNNHSSYLPKVDEALREAQQAARAKQLRFKFENIRERFEKMQNAENQPQPTGPRYKVNRFVKGKLDEPKDQN